MQFIHAADLHLDSPMRGLARYEGAPVDRLRGATRRALERLVDLALRERVDFVLLAGDIYDQDWQDFHTGLFFREQMARLGQSGVRVFIVQGNHDAQGVISRPLLLPANVHTFSHRKAETVRLDELKVAVHGHSFPNRAVTEDLVPAYPPAVPGWFNIGLLHTSLTGRAGHDTYAPTRLEALVDKGYDYWALGHVHAREVLREASPRIVFSGNLQGRAAFEAGPKGCELVRVEAGKVEAEFVPLDVVRWSRVDVDLGDAHDLSAVSPRVHDALAPVLQGSGDVLHAVRVRLTGTTALHAREALQPGLLAAAVQAAAQDVSRAEVWVEQVRLALRAPIDRGELAAREDAIGELARLVDGLAADPAALAAWSQDVCVGLLQGASSELAGEELARLMDAQALRELLLDGEATVHARLAASAAGLHESAAPEGQP